MLAMQEHFFLNKGTYNFKYKKQTTTTITPKNQPKPPKPQSILNTEFITPSVSVDFIMHLLWSLVLNTSIKA